MNPVLRVLAPHVPPVKYVLEPDHIRLGRDDDNDIVVRVSKVSSHHLELRREGDGFRLIDTASTNGTQVNGERVTSVLLMDGDEILIGGEVFATYSSGETEQPVEAPPWRGNAALPLARPPIRIASPRPPLARKPGAI
jgi:pSer/pThr/pTyr-binding forkhead associated (FHA) protein